MVGIPYATVAEVVPSDKLLGKVPMSKRSQKVQIIPKVVYLGTLESNCVVQGLPYVELNLSTLPLFIFHNILN